MNTIGMISIGTIVITFFSVYRLKIKRKYRSKETLILLLKSYEISSKRALAIFVFGLIYSIMIPQPITIVLFATLLSLFYLTLASITISCAVFIFIPAVTYIRDVRLDKQSSDTGRTELIS